MDKFEQIDGKLDKLDSRLDSIGITLIKQGKDLSFHIKRTNLLEESLKETQKDIKPIQKHVEHVKGVIQAMGVLSVVVALVSGILKIFRIL